LRNKYTMVGINGQSCVNQGVWSVIASFHAMTAAIIPNRHPQALPSWLNYPHEHDF
jgi:hypothetical protein